jgi:hypothetical protein
MMIYLSSAGTQRMWHMLLCLLGILALAACGRLAPANVPAQLEHTPGPPVVIADGFYHSVAFSLRVPPRWQIVTSPASSPPWVVFISPDADAVIIVAVDEKDTLNVQPPHVEGEQVRRVEAIELSDGSAVHAVLVAGAAVVDAYAEVYRRVVESINAA